MCCCCLTRKQNKTPFTENSTILFHCNFEKIKNLGYPGEFDSEYSHSPGYASDENSYVDPHAYIAEYAEDDMSALSLGSDSDLWSLDDGDKQYCPGDDVDATSERIASAFIDMHKL